MQRSIILPRIFLVTRKSTSRLNWFSGLERSTKPRFWGMGSLKIRRPTVVSINRLTLPLVIRTLILAWRVTTPS